MSRFAVLFLGFTIVLSAVPAYAEHEDFDADDGYAEEVEQNDDTPRVEVQSQSRSILNMDENQLRQVITTTIELQSGEAKEEQAVSVPPAIPERRVTQTNLLQGSAQSPNSNDVIPQAVAPRVQTPSPASAWVTVLNPVRWINRDVSSGAVAVDPESSDSLRMRTYSKVVEWERQAKKAGARAGAKAAKRENQKLAEKVSAFFERFATAVNGAKAGREAASAPDTVEAVEDGGGQEREVGSVSDARPGVYAAMAPGSPFLEENGQNPIGITFIAMLGWLGFLFCLFLMYRLRSSVKERRVAAHSSRSHGTSRHSSSARKSWSQSYPHGETVVNPRGKT